MISLLANQTKQGVNHWR